MTDKNLDFVYLDSTYLVIASRKYFKLERKGKVFAIIPHLEYRDEILGLNFVVEKKYVLSISELSESFILEINIPERVRDPFDFRNTYTSINYSSNDRVPAYA